MMTMKDINDLWKQGSLRSIGERVAVLTFPNLVPAIVGLAILIGGWLAGSILYRISVGIGKGCGKKTKGRVKSYGRWSHLAGMVLQIVTILFAFVISLHVAEIPFSTVAALGVVGIVAAGAMGPFLSNATPSLMMNADEFFKAGEWVVVDQVHQGQVIEIGRVVTVLYDKAKRERHIIPNRRFFDGPYTVKENPPMTPSVRSRLQTLVVDH